MSKKQPEINLVIHYPNSSDGFRILLGRNVLFNQLIKARNSGEVVNLNYKVSQFTDEDALCAYQKELERMVNRRAPN